MDDAELWDAVRAEGLDSPVFEDGGALEDSVVIRPVGDHWEVFLMGERGWPVESTRRVFDDPSGAREYALLKLRHVTRAREAMARMEARRLGHASSQSSE